MGETRRILVAVDDSDATRAALARVAAGHAHGGSTIRLFHVVGPIPPSLLESGGGATPEGEERAAKALEVAESAWFAKAREAARPILEQARETLRAGGIAAERITVHVAESLPEDRLATLILVEPHRRSGLLRGHRGRPRVFAPPHAHLGLAGRHHDPRRRFRPPPRRELAASLPGHHRRIRIPEPFLRATQPALPRRAPLLSASVPGSPTGTRPEPNKTSASSSCSRGSDSTPPETGRCRWSPIQRSAQPAKARNTSSPPCRSWTHRLRALGMDALTPDLRPGLPPPGSFMNPDRPFGLVSPRAIALEIARRPDYHAENCPRWPEKSRFPVGGKGVEVTSSTTASAPWRGRHAPRSRPPTPTSRRSAHWRDWRKRDWRHSAGCGARLPRLPTPWRRHRP